MADNDELQQSLDTLGRHVFALTRQMSKAGKQIDSLNRTVGDLVAQNKAQSTKYPPDTPRGDNTDKFINKVLTALEKYAGDTARTKQGKVNKIYLNQMKNRLESNFIPRTDITGRQITAYKAYNSNTNISDVVDVNEGTQAFKDFLDDIKELMRKFDMSAANYKSFYEEIGIGDKQNKNKFNISERVRPIYDETGKLQNFEDISSDFAKLRDDVVALRRTLGETSKEVQTSNSHFTALSTNLQDLVDKSKTLNDIFEKINTSSTTLQNTSLPGLTTAVGDARTAMNNFVSGQNNALASLNKSINNTIKTQQTVTNQIIQTAQKQSQQTQTGSSGNTFSRQVQKNDERARQAGFIAMLIPALAKLIEKTPFSDFIKVAGLMIGKFMPEIGALVASLAPLIGASILTKGGSSLVKMFTGKGAGKLAGGALKGAGASAGLGMTNSLGGVWGSRASMGAKLRYTRRWGEGFVQAGQNTFDPKYIQNYTSRGNAGNWGKMREGIITGRYNMDPNFTGDPRFAAKANVAGRIARRNLFRRASVNVGRAGKFIGRGMPLWAAGVEVIGDVFDGRFSQAYQREGWGGVGKQTLKTGGKAALSAGGAWAGGLAGAKIGAMLGTFAGPLGTAIGGTAGALIGSIVGSGLAKSLGKLLFNTGKFITKTNKELIDSTWRLVGVREKEHPILSKIAQTLMLMNPLLTLLVGGIKKLAFGDTSDPNKLTDEGVKQPGIWGRIKNQFNTHQTYNKAKNQSNLDARKYQEMQYWLANASKVGTDIYNAEIRGFSNEYDSLYGMKPGSTVGGAYTDEYKQVRAQYAHKKLAEKIKNKKTQFNFTRAKIATAQEIDESQLVDPGTMLNWTQAQAESILSKRTGAYERLQNRSGYWTVGNSFYHDVPYVGKGKQAQLAAMVDAGLPAGFTITSAMGAKGNHDGKYGHTARYNKGHFSVAGNVIDIAYNNQKDWDNAVNYLEQLKRAGVGINYIDERPGKPGAKYMRTGANLHIELSNSVKTANLAATQARIAAETATSTTQQTSASLQASSEIREGLAKAIGEKKREDKTARARNIIFSAVDVTGSLGVWGITQINNTGRDAGRMRTGI